MNIQNRINKLILALKMKGFVLFIDKKQFYSEDLDKLCTKYIVHEGNPREGETFYSQLKLLNYLANYYKKVSDSSWV